MTHRKKPQSIAPLVIVVFSAVLLSALAAVVYPVPVVYADDPEIIMITVTSSLETYFYDPGLDPTGGTVYFNSVGGEGAGQMLTVTTTVTGSMPITLTGAAAFGMMPIPDTNSTGELGIDYTIGINANTENGVLFTVTNSDGLTDTAVITFTQDNVTPAVEFTDVTDPGYDYDPDWSEPLDELDTDGSNWYDPDNLSAGWYFTSTATDTLSGLALANVSWDHSNDAYDQSINDSDLDGNGVFNGVSDDEDGVVTVTLTITDNVGNSSASDIVVFNLDNTEPITTSAYISESSVYLYADGLTIYYGDGMGSSVQAFAVYGQSDDGGGVGLGSVDFSLAFGRKPHNQGTLSDWWGEYYVTCFNTDSGTITVTVSDRLGNLDYQTFDYIWDTEPPTVAVSCPLTTSEPSFRVRWDGSDPSPGASVKNYDVQFSEVSSDGPWQNWYMDTPLTQATFGPASPVIVKDNHTYYFRVQAEDNVSNEGPYTNGEDATTYDPGTKKVFLPIVMAPDPNWDFETGDFTSWQHGGELDQSVSSTVHRCGNYSALLGSPNYACDGVPVGKAWLRRSVKVPSSDCPILSFWYRIYTQDKNSALSDQYDLFAVYINDSQLVVKDANTSDPYGCSTLKDLGWKQVVFPLNAYKGKTIEIDFYNYNRPDKWGDTYTYVDCVSVQ